MTLHPRSHVAPYDIHTAHTGIVLTDLVRAHTLGNAFLHTIQLHTLCHITRRRSPAHALPVLLRTIIPTHREAQHTHQHQTNTQHTPSQHNNTSITSNPHPLKKLTFATPAPTEEGDRKNQEPYISPN